MQSINQVKISGVVASQPKIVGNKMYKYTIKTTETNNNGKTVHSFIPVASNQKVSKGDLVTLTGKITTASQKHEDGSYTNFWNVLASKVENQGEINPDSLTKAANKIKNYKVNQSTNKKHLTDNDKKEKALQLAKQLLAEYGE